VYKGTISQSIQYTTFTNKREIASKVVNMPIPIFIIYYCATRDLSHTHPNSYPYFITAIKHGYRCFIS